LYEKFATKVHNFAKLPNLLAKFNLTQSAKFPNLPKIAKNFPKQSKIAKNA